MITVPEDGFTVSRPRRISVESFGLGRQSDTIEEVLAQMLDVEVGVPFPPRTINRDPATPFPYSVGTQTIVARDWLPVALQHVRTERRTDSSPLGVQYESNLVGMLHERRHLTWPPDPVAASDRPATGHVHEYCVPGETWGEVWIHPWHGVVPYADDEEVAALGLAMARAILIAVWHLPIHASLYLDPEMFEPRADNLLWESHCLEYAAFEQQILGYRSDAEREAMLRFWPEDLVDVWLQAYDQPDIAARVDAAIREFGKEPEPDDEG